MRKMKRAIAIILTLCMMLSTNVLNIFAETTTTVTVDINGNEGTFVPTYEGNVWDSTNGFGADVTVGSTLRAAGYTIATPVYWESSRSFVGWTVNVWQEITDDWGNSWEDWVQIAGTSIMTTDDMLDYPIPDAQVMFKAQWDGDDDDYMTQIYIDGYNSTFTGNRIEYQMNDQGVEEKIIQDTEVYEFVFGQYLKENGTGIAEQCKSYWEFGTEPVRTDAKFEGWLEFKVTQAVDDEGYTYEKNELVSDTVYTTAHMLAKEVPEYTVRYVAKWSDMEADEYYYDGPTVDVWFHGNGGTFEGTNVYGTEETEGFGTPCIPGKAVGKRVSEITDPVYWNADPDNNVAGRKFLGWRLVDEPETSIDNPFTDVKEGTYSTTAILWAYENGITLGKSAVTFGPTDACLRGQVVAFLYRLANMD